LFIVDGHCDTLHAMLIKEVDFSDSSLQVSKKLLDNCSKEGMLQFFAVFESPSNPMEKQKADVRAMIDSYHKISDENDVKTILSKEDLQGKGVKALLSLEGLYFMEGEIELLDSLYDDGVRCMSLTWNPDNEFAGGVSGVSGGGLTEKGLELVKKAFEKGILIDVSHITDKGYWDIAEAASISMKPFVATHSNARKLCGHKRNLDDRMLKELARAGGVTGINMFSCFLSDKCESDINDVIRHIEHICSIIGPSHVGFGSDFDGIDREKSAIAGPCEIADVLERLLKLNYLEKDVLKIASGNFLRVLEEVL